MLRWYYFVSYWIFIWFILFKLNLIKYSPYLIYLCIVIYITIKLSIFFFNYKIKKKFKIQNKNVLYLLLFLILVIDITPFFLLKKEINNESTIFTLILIAIYLFTMIQLDVDIYKLYIKLNCKKLLDDYTVRFY